ncbi:hypothetical protein [Aquimarina sp. AU58]|uniref:hypothetical protein n=1 Tax=Aquimarina sp. AU58 TaxID=1874112 RepID=UPI0013576C5D|nr:hypothetical protein [Aquimarina sp. AU58]
MMNFVMKDNFKDTYDFEVRLATMNEITNLSGYLAKKKWGNYKKTKNSLGVKTTRKEAVDFIKKEKTIILQLIGDKVLVQEYKKFDISIFVFNYIQEHDTNMILSMTFRVLQTKRGMEKLEADDAIFDLNRLKRRSYHKRKSKSGRHDRPKDESVQKAIEIREYLRVNPDENRDRVCHEFGLSKTTYYRTLKWLEHRRN